ncbi:MAG TPA: response regulator transcription factor [Niabella sp.]|nr:response regulator transcription factor [Niabella sp.]HOZ95668.1 response regulator transcription factor [Niabella sp.]HQW13908.1 response regulator transcription factor [Niabella sp.]HQX19199.1 response regulator transcription factor [Niabella sp.]HQX41337.1 response regulator transcription factor [Niabella sp.]
MIKVLLYDDVEQFRNATALLLIQSGEFEVVGKFDNCETVIEDVHLLQPDVILMDIDMPVKSGIEGVQMIRSKNDTVKIIMLTVFDNNNNIYDAIRFGANGYVLKKSTPFAIINSIKEVYEGGAPMNASIATQVLQMFASMSPVTKNYGLSEKEKAVLKLLVDGNSYKMVANSLKISVDTVRTHIRNIYEKLQVNSKSAAVAKALKDRII